MIYTFNDPININKKIQQLIKTNININTEIDQQNRQILLMKNKVYQQFYPTKEYQAKTPLERQQYVQSIQPSQQQYKNYIKNCQYPEKDFILLEGDQNGKKIKLMTFRYPSITNSPKAIVAIFHCYFVHSGYTAHLAKKLSQSGYTVVAFDLRGHGLSEGQRGQWNDHLAIIKQSFDFLKKVENIYPQVPLFVYGWGLGAMNILHINLYQYNQINFAGIILASGVYNMPVLGETFKLVRNIVLKIINIFPLKIGIFYRNFDFFTKYKNISKMLQQDQLNTQQQSSSITAQEINNLIQDIPERLWDKIQTSPIVILHGQLDKYGNGYNSYTFYKNIKTKDKQFWYYPKMDYGGFLFDIYFEEVTQRLIQWLDKHTQIWQNKNQKSYSK